jgi:hypothetical protein
LPKRPVRNKRQVEGRQQQDDADDDAEGPERQGWKPRS